MENYEELLNTKYLLGTPKEQYEWVDALVKRNIKLEVANNNLVITLESIKEHCSETIQGLIDIALDVNPI